MDEFVRYQLGRLLVSMDEQLNRMDSLVWEATRSYNRNDDSRRFILYNRESRFPAKDVRDDCLSQRNALAGLLGFKQRGIHDWSPRGYAVVDGSAVVSA